jgi:hypothetical protein
MKELMLDGYLPGIIMLIGEEAEKSEPAYLNSSRLLRHVGILGNTGSGKTVMAKIIVEECTLAGIPTIILDLQGDLARLALPTEPDPLIDLERQKEWKEKSEVRIWTPLEDSGLPICISPFKLPSSKLGDDESMKAWDRMAAGIAENLGHNPSKPSHLIVKAFFLRLLVRMVDRNSIPKNFSDLAKSIRDEDPSEYDDLIKSSIMKDLERRANSLDSGVQSRLYNLGSPLNIPLLLKPRLKGRTPVNVLYLNTLPDESMKMDFIQQFCRELYDWMIQNPSDSDEPQIMVFLDEAGPYIPPDPRMPTSKSMIRQLLKEGRKYGIGFMLASQSPGDLDYRTFGQANTLFIGRFTAPQDIKKVSQILGGIQTSRDVAPRLTTLEPGQFLVVTSGSEDGGVSKLNARRLLTNHGPPIPSHQLSALVSKATREWAGNESYIKSDDSTIISEKIRATAQGVSRNSSKINPQSPPVLSGFTHLADKSDPLHVLMGMTNLIAAATLILCTYTLGNLWQEGTLSQLPFILSAAICILMGIGLTLEFLLQENSELSNKIRSRARPLEALVLIWIWVLWLINKFGIIDLSDWSFMILISQTLVTTFFLLEAIHRIRLGNIDVDGDSLLQKVKSAVRGFPAILTGAEIEELKSTSKQIHNNLRRFMEVLTVGLLLVLMATQLTLQMDWVNNLSIRIVSLDIILLLSTAFASWQGNR